MYNKSKKRINKIAYIQLYLQILQEFQYFFLVCQLGASLLLQLDSQDEVNYDVFFKNMWDLYQ